MHNSKSIIMITTVYSIYCCKQFVYLSTCSLVHLPTCKSSFVTLSSSQATRSLVYSFTRQLFKVPLSSSQATRSLVYSSTRLHRMKQR